jgi:UDP-N-acetyl-D-mannosaminuronate dehydrogenase
VSERDGTGRDRRDADRAGVPAGASDLDGEALRLFIGWSEASERPVKGARVGIVGITFNEDVLDLRNSRVRDIVAELRELAFAAFVADPLADPDEAKRECSTGWSSRFRTG